jgi:hypothetical protein
LLTDKGVWQAALGEKNAALAAAQARIAELDDVAIDQAILLAKESTIQELRAKVCHCWLACLHLSLLACGRAGGITSSVFVCLR